MYNINTQFQPVDIELQENEWLYIVNYYGQLSDDHIKNEKKNISVLYWIIVSVFSKTYIGN